jgi:hypothetical protein
MDESIAQLFFDPDGGRLYAIWTTPQIAAQLQTLPEAAVADRWQQHFVIWQKLFSASTDPTVCMESECWPAFRYSMAVNAVATALIGFSEASSSNRVRLTVLWPGELAQLPWESLEIFQDNGLDLQRAISLASWQQGRQAANAESGAAILYAQRGDSLPFRWQDASQAGAFWVARTPPLDPQNDNEASPRMISCGN